MNQSWATLWHRRFAISNTSRRRDTPGKMNRRNRKRCPPGTKPIDTMDMTTIPPATAAEPTCCTKVRNIFVRLPPRFAEFPKVGTLSGYRKDTLLPNLPEYSCTLRQIERLYSVIYKPVVKNSNISPNFRQIIDQISLRLF
jgi:hypothetical protein